MSSNFRKSAAVEWRRKKTNPLIPSANKMNRIKHTRYVSIFLLLRFAARSPLFARLSLRTFRRSRCFSHFAMRSQHRSEPRKTSFFHSFSSASKHLTLGFIASFSFFFISHIVALEKTRMTRRRSALQVSANRVRRERETESRETGLSRRTSTRNRI